MPGSASIFPRRNGIRFTPEPAPLSPGFSLGLPVGRLEISAGMRNILPINPGESTARLFKVHIDAGRA